MENFIVTSLCLTHVGLCNDRKAIPKKKHNSYLKLFMLLNNF